MEASRQAADAWALDGAGLAAVVAAIEAGRTQVIECGSGASTVAMARALRTHGGGKIQALEHLAPFAARTRGLLRAEGLEAFAEVLHAPLVVRRSSFARTLTRTTNDERRTTTPWYSDNAVAKLAPNAELLLVDGPPGDCGAASRAPALSRLASKLSPGCLVMLDDADRPGEAYAIREWERDHGVAFERVAPRLVAGTLP